ncbi:hypothetical protein [Variovorax sp. UC122_21]|uniref:hypothetical protein n=1 Tax=Variovorax sp. UC122_21 TaxID=3374554 RepID=UPI003758095B
MNYKVSTDRTVTWQEFGALMTVLFKVPGPSLWILEASRQASLVSRFESVPVVKLDRLAAVDARV